jgi:hypothetical protein
MNITLYTLTAAHLRTVLEVQKHVMVLNVTVEVEPGEDFKKELLKALEGNKDLEQVEIVANPSLQFFMAVRIQLSELPKDVLITIPQLQNPRAGVLAKSFPSADDIMALNRKCPKLTSFKASVLRTTSFGSVNWEKKDNKWSGGVKEGQRVRAS